MSTDVEQVSLFYGKPNEKKLSSMTVDEALKYHAEGHFRQHPESAKINQRQLAGAHFDYPQPQVIPGFQVRTGISDQRFQIGVQCHADR